MRLAVSPCRLVARPAHDVRSSCQVAAERHDEGLQQREVPLHQLTARLVREIALHDSRPNLDKNLSADVQCSGMAAHWAHARYLQCLVERRLDGRDVSSTGLHRQHPAALRGHTVEMNDARSTLPGIAPDLVPVNPSSSHSMSRSRTRGSTSVLTG